MGGGVGTDIGYVGILWGQGRGLGDRHWGLLILGRGLGTDMGMFILWGWGSFGTNIGDVNIP